MFIWVSPHFLGTTLHSIYTTILGPVLDLSPRHLEAGYDFTPSLIVSEIGEMRTLVAYELGRGLGLQLGKNEGDVHRRAELGDVLMVLHGACELLGTPVYLITRKKGVGLLFCLNYFKWFWELATKGVLLIQQLKAV